MNPGHEQLRNKLHDLSQAWLSRGIPSAEALDLTATALNAWKKDHGVTGIWTRTPLMVTATIDDGIGQGIEIISRYAKVAGLRIQPLGLMQHPDDIIDTCLRCRPAILGLTILQLDSDEALAHIGCNLPPNTALVAGGPVFKFDPDMARRCRVTFAATSVAHFINYLLDWEPIHGTTDR